MGEVVNTAAKAAKKGVKKGFKIWLACILAIILVVTSAGGSFLILSKVFEAKLNQMVNDQYKGETGEQGPQGPQGVSILSIEKTGASGNYDIYTISYSNGLTTTFQVKNGDDGEAPTIGENGNWWINGEDTGVLADVELNMPYIGTNGNWWLGDSDTNVKAQGQDGLTPYIKDGNWWIGETDTGVVASGTGTGTGVGITTITPLDKTSDDYKNYLAVHSDLDADLTDVYKILYSNETVSYFHVTNGRDGGNGAGNGANGADANRWLNGTTEPADTLGNPGDFYLHTPTNDVYQKQITGTATNQYDGVLVEQTLDADTFAKIRDNAASYGIALNQGSVDFAENVNIAQINAMTTATELEQSFYYYHWNYREDVTHGVVHLFGYYAAEGALQVNGSIVTKIHYEWTKVTTLNGADGSDGTNGKSAYEVWRDYTEEDGTQPNAGKDENEFLNSLIIGSLEDFTILPSGFWGKKTAADFDIDEIDDYEKYLYEEIDGVYYKNTMVAARGEQGVIGQQGEQGVQGERGYSAYELYTQTTKDNPVKSMNDWLASLVGGKGDQGEAGYTPYVGPNGNWWINNTDTGVSATVRLPYIGENGNWFINGVDQGIKPTGERGNGIAKINVTTSADGIVSTYRIIFTDPEMEPFVFNVTNGTDGESAYEVWRDYTDDEGNQPNLHKSAAEFFQALMGTDGNGIESVELVARGDSGNDYVDTYKVTYTAQDPYYFTVRNGRDGKSVYDIWCEQQGLTDYADNKYYAEFIDAMTVSTIQGLTVLDNGHWGVLSNYETVEDANAADPDGIYSVGYQNKIYKDTGNAAKGDTGATGKSAYEIYVYYFNNNAANNGKSPLSEFEWLESLKGATGAAGKDAQLEITESGYWKIGGVVTNMKVQGEKGEQGDTPYIDADGYWCVGNTNLGVLAKGPQGPKGDTGATGISITGVSKLGSDGAVDTYEIAFSNGDTSTFTVTNGTNGKDGASISMDFGVPTVMGATGKNGDIYINLNNGEMYRFNNGWGTVVGTMRGSQWFTGTMTLTNLNSGSSGVNIDGYSVIKNDIYLNTDSRDIYKYDGNQWVYLSSLGGQIGDIEVSNLINKALEIADAGNRGLRVCYVSPETTVKYQGKVLNCHQSIGTAIDTEYNMMTWERGLAVIILPGTYTENIRLYGKKNVSIIGVSNRLCNLIGYEDDEKKGYYYPPLWINPSTEVIGLTISNPTTRNRNDSYCIHTDDDGTGRVLIKDCQLVNYQHACIGFGTRQNAPLFIEDCSLTSGSTNGNCLYGHNSCAVSGAITVNEELHITRCYMRTAYDNAPALDIFDANHFYPSGTKNSLDWLIYMNDNVITDGLTAIPTTLTKGSYKEVYTSSDYFSKYIRKMPSNSGNNCSFANYKNTDNYVSGLLDANDCISDNIGDTIFLVDVSGSNLPSTETTHWLIRWTRYGLGANDLGVQVATATHSGNMYVRNYNSGSFGSWKKITLE